MENEPKVTHKMGKLEKLENAFVFAAGLTISHFLSNHAIEKELNGNIIIASVVILSVSLIYFRRNDKDLDNDFGDGNHQKFKEWSRLELFNLSLIIGTVCTYLDKLIKS